MNAIVRRASCLVVVALAVTAPSPAAPDASTTALGAVGALLGATLIIILLALVAAFRLMPGRTSEAEVLPAENVVPSDAIGFPTYDPRFTGISTELVKRFELRQVSRTLERQLAVNDQSLRLVKQLEDLEAGKVAILAKQYAQRLAPHEHRLRLEQIEVESDERKARRAKAELSIAESVLAKKRLENPEPPTRQPTQALLIRKEAKTKAVKVSSKLAVLAAIEREEQKALAKADPEEQSTIREAYRRVKDELREEI